MKKFAVLLGLAALAFAQEDAPDKRMRNATETFKEIMGTPDKAIPNNLLSRAKCVIIVPDMKKAAFVIGGQYGRGFATCRNGNQWSGPAAVRMTGGSVGLQLGGDSTDVILLVMNDRGLKHLLSDKFKIGAEAAAAAGPVGRDAKAETDVLMNAEILSWSRTKGVFAGISLNGTVVEADKSENRKLYGRDVSNQEVIQGNVAATPASHDLLSALGQYPASSEGADRRK